MQTGSKKLFEMVLKTFLMLKHYNNNISETFLKLNGLIIVFDKRRDLKWLKNLEMSL